jgi:hypothetical protein
MKPEFSETKYRKLEPERGRGISPFTLDPACLKMRASGVEPDFAPAAYGIQTPAHQPLIWN